MDSFLLRITTPDGCAFEGAVESVVAPGLTGSFGVLARHAPMISALRRGILRAQEPGTGATRYFVTADGVLEVTRAEVSILTGAAVCAGSRDEADRVCRQLFGP